jgi:hypothetical protein
MERRKKKKYVVMTDCPVSAALVVLDDQHCQEP